MMRAQDTERTTRNRLPVLLWVVAISTTIGCIGGSSILTFSITGVAWVIPLVFSLLIVTVNFSRISFPVLIWMPWIVLVLLYWSASEFSSFQRSIQLIAPIVTGVAVSSYRYSEERLARFLRLCTYLALAVIAIVIAKTGLLVTGELPELTGLAAEVMTVALLCSLFVARYAFGEKRSIVWWWVLAVLPVISVTRTAILVSLLTLPLSFAPLRLWKRCAVIATMLIIGIGLFYTPRVQSKMFYSGSGNLSDIFSADFRTSGRTYIWDALIRESERNPLWGSGANASEDFVRKITRNRIAHPHNDWLRFLYDYGYVGVSVFALTLLAQVAHLLKNARRTNRNAKLLFLAGASSFVSFVLIMFTDNIVLYAAFFGNLQFAILGVAYGAATGGTHNEKNIFSSRTFLNKHLFSPYDKAR